MFDRQRNWIVDKLQPAPTPSPGRIPAEIGSTGLRMRQGIIEEQAIKALRMRTRKWEAFREMREYDDTVSAVMHAIEMTMRRVPWEVMPVDETPEQLDAAEFLESCIDDMSHSWPSFISEWLWMLTYGFSVFEILYKLRVGPEQRDSMRRSKWTDRKIGWRKFAPRSAESIERWLTDDAGGIAGVEQVDPNTNKQIQIPIENLLLFTTTSYLNNPEGRSVLQGAYIPWYDKKNIRELELIGAERDLVGFPVMYVPGELFDPNNSLKAAEKTAWQKIVEDMRRDEQDGLLLPGDMEGESGERAYKIELVKSPGSKQFDTTEIIRQRNQAIAGVVLADWIQLGHENVGSRALSTDKTSMFEASLDGWMESGAEVLNRHAVPRLFAMNRWRPSAGLPEFRPGKVGREDVEKLMKAILMMAQAGFPIGADDTLESHLRTRLELPEKVEMEEPLPPEEPPEPPEPPEEGDME